VEERGCGMDRGLYGDYRGGVGVRCQQSIRPMCSLKFLLFGSLVGSLLLTCIKLKRLRILLSQLSIS
jgi:hypothetical protein